MTAVTNSKGGSSRALRVLKRAPGLILSAMNRVAAPETVNRISSRQGLSANMGTMSHP
jgi:hypothetical protein